MKRKDVKSARHVGRGPRWLGRIGKLGFAFFFVKGLAWMILPVAVWLMD